MITKLKRIHRRLLVGCAIFSALSLSIALAEYRDVSAGNVPAHINSWRQRIPSQFGDYARAWSSTDVQIDRLYVELHTFSNDPGNEPTHSWQLKDAKAADVSDEVLVLGIDPSLQARTLAALRGQGKSLRVASTPWTDEPATGQMPDQTFLGRAVIELWDDQVVVAITGSDPRVLERAIHMLSRSW